MSDDSPPKPSDSCNPYELAKTAAENQAAELVEAHSPRLKITFLDWISVVPNLAPNFTIGKMCASALESGTITFSPGDYGRPLLDATQAGEALLLLTERRLRGDDSGGDDCKGDGGERGAGKGGGTPMFTVQLIPGAFTTFETFAKIVVEAVAPRPVVLVEQEKTPDFLRARCESASLTSLGFEPSEERVLLALRATADAALARLRGGGGGK